MSAGVLTTLDRVKGWSGLPLDNTAADVQLSQLIKSASAFVHQYCNRDSFGKTRFEESYDGYGKNWIALRQPNVLSVSRLISGPHTLSAASGSQGAYTNGYVVRGQRLELFGSVFPNGRSGIWVEYDAGFFAADEPHTIPATGEYKVVTDRFWVSGEAVTLANGTALTKVASAPAAGQYSVSEGEYTFNAAQAGAAVLISYSFAPDDIVQATTELVGERYAYKGRIGHSSKSLGGQETVAYSANRVPEHLLELMNPYRRVV